MVGYMLIGCFGADFHVDGVVGVVAVGHVANGNLVSASAEGEGTALSMVASKAPMPPGIWLAMPSRQAST